MSSPPGQNKPSRPELAVAAGVVENADRSHRAEDVLRLELKELGGVEPQQARRISVAVAAYYRWHAWLDQTSRTARQIEEACEFADEFARKPDSFSEKELLAM